MTGRTPETAGPWLDDAAGRLVRPYTVSDGRTRPTSHFDLLTMVMATGVRPRDLLDVDHADVLELCGTPVTVAEIAARIRLPATVIKVLLSDLLESRVVATRAFDPAPLGPGPADRELLEAVLDGLRRQL
ncbi:DUF742 domain-containing protein [Streptomyces sp. NPDC048636]|uniref:DUF742 domain-containing protein n=1 Tax=Streptomyces sp. NPDC048636 TaxID=3155762 RepID=UPI00342A28B2